MATSLHKALKTESLDTRSSRAGELKLVRLQHGKDKDTFTTGVHVRPSASTGRRGTTMLLVRRRIQIRHPVAAIGHAARGLLRVDNLAVR